MNIFDVQFLLSLLIMFSWIRSLLSSWVFRIRLLQYTRNNKKLVGKDEQGNAFCEELTPGETGRLRRFMVPGIYNDFGAADTVHPLWRTWLSFRGPPPTPEQVKEYDQAKKIRLEIAEKYDKKELERKQSNETKKLL